MSHFFNDMHYSNFVLNFKVDQISAIRNDILMHRKGYLFYYAIDTYDIINHYMPYTDSSFFNHGNRSQVAQKAIAYEKFFTSFLNTKMIVLDEYKLELFAAKNYIEKQIKNAGVLRRNIDILVQEIDSMQKGDADDRERVRKNVELILFLLILSENKGSIHSNFFEFLKTKLSIFKFDTANESRNELLDSIFEDTVPSSQVGEVYDIFADNIGYELAGFDSDFERYTYLDNSYRDIEVIDRLSAINQKLETAHPGENVRFIYLSSAPFKTRRILSIFTELNKNDHPENHIPTKDFGFHRNIFQCFLFKLLIEEFPDCNDPTPLQILDALKEMIKERDTLNMDVEVPIHLGAGKPDAVLEVLGGILERYSSNIDNHFYFKIYNKYKTILELTGDEKNDQIAGIVNKVQAYLKEEKIMSDGNDILYNIGQYKQTFVLSQIFQNSNNAIFIHLNFGKDIVRDSFHHLPYLLFIQDSVNKSLTDNLYPLFDTISDFSTYKYERVEEIIPYLWNIFKQLSVDTGSLSNLAVRLLLTAYLYLITEGRDQQSNNKAGNSFSKKEVKVIEALKKQKRILENSALALVKADDGKRMEIQKKQTVLAKEFDYLLIWLLRRNQQYKEAIDLGNELVTNYNDGRFFHGLALSYVAQAYSLVVGDNVPENRSETIISLLDNSLVYMQKAKAFYSDLLMEINNEYAISLVRKTLMSVCNSIADQSVRKYQLLGMLPDDAELLETARACIDEIKVLSGEMGIPYTKLVIYNFTEAELEYYETLVYLSKHDLTRAYVTIVNATNRIAEANTRENAMNQVFRQIENNVKMLRIDIFKQKGILK